MFLVLQLKRNPSNKEKYAAQSILTTFHIRDPGSTDSSRISVSRCSDTCDVRVFQQNFDQTHRGTGLLGKYIYTYRDVSISAVSRGEYWPIGKYVGGLRGGGLGLWICISFVFSYMSLRV